jgi:flagellar hook-length control protein FliK
VHHAAAKTAPRAVRAPKPFTTAPQPRGAAKPTGPTAPRAAAALDSGTTTAEQPLAEATPASAKNRPAPSLLAPAPEPTPTTATPTSDTSSTAPTTRRPAARQADAADPTPAPASPTPIAAIVVAALPLPLQLSPLTPEAQLPAADDASESAHGAIAAAKTDPSTAALKTPLPPFAQPHKTPDIASLSPPPAGPAQPDIASAQSANAPASPIPPTAAPAITAVAPSPAPVPTQPAAASATPASPAAQLGPVLIALGAGADSQRVTIQLTPETLGRVQISVVRASGSAVVSVIAERADTLALLQSDSSQLHAALDRAGFADTRTLSFHLADASHAQPASSAASHTGGQADHAPNNRPNPVPPREGAAQLGAQAAAQSTAQFGGQSGAFQQSNRQPLRASANASSNDFLDRAALSAASPIAYARSAIDITA